MCTLLGYYILDRLIKHDVYYNIEKQGITNENHSKFNDKLIDFSGYGRNLTLSNFAWEGNSGIGNYPVVFGANKTWRNKAPEGPNSYICTINANKYNITQILLSNAWSYSYIKENGELTNYNKDVESFKIKVTGIKSEIPIRYSYLSSTDATVTSSIIIKSDGIYKLPKSFANDGSLIDNYGWIGFSFTRISADIPNIITDVDVTIEIIPSNKNAICFDGVNDYGKVTGLPIYKDYTFIIDRKVISIGETAGVVASKSESSTDTTKQGAFLFEYLGAPNYISTWSFYEDNHKVGETDFTRSISYQSKYNYNGIELSPGTSLDSDKLWLGIVRDNDSRFANIAVYSLMSFPYSMSEFLIERQLKMYNLGTLYPGMVEFRPIVKSNVKWNIIEIWQGDKSLYRPAVNDNKTGIYLKRDSTIGIYVKPYVGQKVSEIVCNGVSYTDLKLNSNGFYYKVVPITKSPQKIGITIEQNENYVLFNPVITSNVEYKNALYYTVTNGVWTRINSGNYINIEERIAIAIFPNGIDELVSVTSSDLNNISTISINNSGEFYYFLANLTSKSPQKINITIYQPPEYLTMLRNSTSISNETLIKNE